MAPSSNYWTISFMYLVIPECRRCGVRQEKNSSGISTGGAREGDQRKKDIFLGRDQMLPRLNSSTLEMRFSSSVSVIIILPSIESISSSSCRIRTYIR